jgi:hypothetical protein
MAALGITGRLIELREQIRHDQRIEILRALNFRDQKEHVKAAYHLGLADGRNNLIRELTSIADAANNKESLER